MSKKTPSRSTKRRAAPAAPIGVRHIFAALSKMGDDPSKAGHDAADVLPFARRIIAIATTGSDVDFVAQLRDATRTVFESSVTDDPGDAPELSGELSAIAGFYTGVATCWLLMTSINCGGAR